MTRLAKAMSAFNFGRSGSADGRDARPFAGRGVTLCGDGSGAPSTSQSEARHAGTVIEAASTDSGEKRHFGTLVRFGLLAVAVPFLALCLLAPSANASKTAAWFAGGPLGQSLGQFSQPRHAAANESTGAIYVADEFNHRIQRLSADGIPELTWGRDVVADSSDTGYEICSTAQSCKSGVAGQGKGEFIFPSGLAVDQADGSVYVWDTRSGNAATQVNARIQKFDSDGNFILMFGKGVNADDGSDICTEASGDECQAGTAGNGAGQLANPSTQRPTLAVHPVSGDVLVADVVNRRVLQYQPDGTFVRGMGWGVRTGANEFQTCTTGSGCLGGLTTAGTQNGRFGANQPRFVTVDSQGILYASDSNLSNRIQRIDLNAPTDADMPQPAIGVGPLLNAVTHGLAVSPDSDGAGPDVDRLFVLRDPASGETVVQELDGLELPGGTPAVAETHGVGDGFMVVQGLGINAASGDLFVSGAFAVGHGAFALTDEGPGLDVAAADVGAAGVTATTAELAGTVDPDGGLVSYRFVYSPDGATFVSSEPALAAGSDPVQVTASVDGLDPATVYTVRLMVEKVVGPSSTVSAESLPQLFMTAAAAPDVTTLGSAARTTTGATLRGLVDPNGSATAYRFEYGPAGGSFDHRVPVPDAAAGGGNTAALVVQPVSGLLPDTAYHYRIVAANSAGESAGDPVVFRTRAESPPAPDGQQRQHELVSPADKIGGIGVGLWYVGPAAIANVGVGAYDGDRFAAHGYTGSMLVESAQAYGNDWAMAERHGGLGWLSHPSITHPASNEEVARLVNMAAASDDLSTTIVRGSGGSALAPFPELAIWKGLGFGPSYVMGWDGRWELFGPTALDQRAPGAVSNLWDTVVSADGSWVLGSARLTAGRTGVGGMAGPGDPSHPDRPDLVGGRAAYAADLSGGPSDEFTVSGARENIGVCTDGTTIPDRDGDTGRLGTQACPPPLGDSDARLVSDRGATLLATDVNILSYETSPNGLISADGSRTFFMSPDPLAGGVPNGTSGFCSGSGAATVCPTQLYLRQRNADGSHSTRWISRAENGLSGDQDASLTGTVRFEGASRDGRRVFFRTNSPLTADDPNGGDQQSGGIVEGTASTASWDLYMYELPSDPDADVGDGTLTRISAGPNGDGDCNVTAGSDAAGALRFVSADGGRAYFTCAAPLPGVGPAGSGTILQPGGTPATTDQANLYLYDGEDGGSWTFVTRLPRSTTAGINGNPAVCATTGTAPQAPLGANGTTGTPDVGFFTLNSNCVRGTSDGAFITFWTTGRLTGDDPDGVSADIYGYDAESDELTRITAPQGGVGGSYPCGLAGSAAAIQCFGDGGFDHTGDEARRGPLPMLGVATDPLVPGDRVAFFQSRSRLVPEDTDDAYDVYEWRNGKLSLVTKGADGPDGAYYKGNDRTGRNVYFVTRDALTWQDYDAVADVYVARIGGGIPQPAPPATCEVLAGLCQGPVSPVPAPSGDVVRTSTQGSGNVRGPAAGCAARARSVRAARQRANRLARRAQRASRPRARQVVRQLRVARRQAARAQRQLETCRKRAARAANANRRIAK